MADLPASDKSNAEHATDFTPPLYNVWKQQTKTEGASHFGNSEVRWVDNHMTAWRTASGIGALFFAITPHVVLLQLSLAWPPRRRSSRNWPARRVCGNVFRQSLLDDDGDRNVARRGQLDECALKSRWHLYVDDGLAGVPC